MRQTASKRRAWSKKSKLYLSFGTPIIILSLIFTYFTFANINTKGDNEWSNNATLIAEVGVGIIVTLFVLMIATVNEHKIDRKISNVLDIVKAREEIQKEKEEIQKEKQKEIYLSIRSSFEDIQNEITIVLNEARMYEQYEYHADKQTSKNQIILSCDRIKQFSDSGLNDPGNLSLEFFDSDTLGMIKTIINLCKNKPKFSDDRTPADVSFCSILKNMIDARIAELNEKIGKEVSLEKIHLKRNVEEIEMMVSSDRTVYPLNSIVHVYANLESIIKEKKIIFELFNSKRKLLLSQTIDPENYENSELARTDMFQACFKMEGKEWKTGETYIARATHSSSYAEDKFAIDQRMPVLQSDKSVYVAGGDMILTVIDPDADKDSEKVEFVGDREDSKIIVESKYGKIDGYRLRETGKSVGIFQGIIGFLPVSRDGTVIPQKFGDKTIDKIQGTGIEDGFIGGRPGDEITISYKNSTNVVPLTVFISNFGAVVDMDEKTYSPTDKVHLTVVAPDFSLDSEKIDEIGQSPPSTIQIQTGADRLENYKLVETGPDTGIFVGELRLVPIDEKPPESSKLRGPNNGILGCNKEDTIEVVFTWWKDEFATAKAIIRS